MSRSALGIQTEDNIKLREDIKKYPSITTILKETETEEKKQALARWRLQVGDDKAEEIRQAAMERGRKIDASVQDYLKTRTTGDRKLDLHLDQFEFVATEQRVASEEWKVKGRFDAILRQGEDLIINDFKGSGKRKENKHLEDYILQLGAYWKILKDGGILCTRGLLTIVVDEPAHIQPVWFTLAQMKSAARGFEQRLKLYRELKGE